MDILKQSVIEGTLPPRSHSQNLGKCKRQNGGESLRHNGQRQRVRQPD